jgi:hypothetical protein
VAAKKSAQYPHQWADGSWHSKPQRTGPAKGINGPLPLPPPPPGTYDPAIDYNAGASQRGYENQRDDGATMYSQGKEDYGLDVGDLTRGRDYSLADLLTGQKRLDADYGENQKEVSRQFGILGRQQGERAAQQGIQSQGLLSKSAQVRGENEGREQYALTKDWTRSTEDIGTARNRTNETFDQGKTRLDLGFGRQFGGYGGNTFNNPLTGQPMVGSLLTNQTRSGTENNAFQTFSGQQRSMQAADNGYIAPGLLQTSPDLRTARRVQRGMRP